MRLIDADKAKAELLRIARDIHDKYQADKFFECATNRVFKIIPKT